MTKNWITKNANGLYIHGWNTQTAKMYNVQRQAYKIIDHDETDMPNLSDIIPSQKKNAGPWLFFSFHSNYMNKKKKRNHRKE